MIPANCLSRIWTGRPKELLRDQLKKDLLGWAVAHNDDIQKRTVKSAIPPSLRADLASFDADAGAGALLKKIVEACSQLPMDEEAMALAYVYMQLAPVVYLIPIADR
jgi:hypothetical protein